MIATLRTKGADSTRVASATGADVHDTDQRTVRSAGTLELLEQDKPLTEDRRT
jgi:hypothetical protein